MHPLKEYMKKTGMSQADLAKIFRVSESFVSYYLKGKRILSLKLAFRISKITGIPLLDLLSGENKKLMGEIHDTAFVEQERRS